MYPNPQEALPLPPGPDLEQYKKRAKELVRACISGKPDAIRAWAVAWVDVLTGLQGESQRPGWWLLRNSVVQVNDTEGRRTTRAGRVSTKSWELQSPQAVIEFFYVRRKV